uniref:Uncharacterized protein n=1 Tax=Myoviridae sp. ctLnO19 TaxID=2825085 RepID=A0A8S5P1Y1_9CAUD|nr:MAG TPA: protein of unknown function (DUF5478) [Myoviridae sp. ctLnO19]
MSKCRLVYIQNTPFPSNIETLNQLKLFVNTLVFNENRPLFS